MAGCWGSGVERAGLGFLSGSVRLCVFRISNFLDGHDVGENTICCELQAYSCHSNFHSLRDVYFFVQVNWLDLIKSSQRVWIMDLNLEAHRRSFVEVR